MREYELMAILRPNLEEEKKNATIERLKGIITDGQGEISKFEEMGKRRLAYEIDKNREGYYVLVNFRATPDVVSELQRVMRISDEVIRFLVVREDE